MAEKVAGKRIPGFQPGIILLTLTLMMMLLLASMGHAAESFLGSKPKVTTVHVTTNYFLMVMGDGTNAVYRLLNPSNALEVLQGLGAASQTDLNGASNTLRTLLVSNDTSTSNALRTILLGADATSSNAIWSAFIAADTTTSNGVMTAVGQRQGGSSTLTNLNTMYLNGTGSPEGVVSARIGALYICTNSCTGSGFYAKTNGTGNTGWWLIQDTGGGGGGLSDGDHGDVIVASSGGSLTIDDAVVTPQKTSGIPTNNNAGALQFASSLKVAGPFTNSGPARMESSLQVNGGQTNAGSLVVQGGQTNAGPVLKMRGANNPEFEITSIGLPQTAFMDSQGIGTRSGGGQPYLLFRPEETATVEITTSAVRPVNGATVTVGEQARPFGGFYGLVAEITGMLVSAFTNSALPTNSLVMTGSAKQQMPATIGARLSMGPSGRLRSHSSDQADAIVWDDFEGDSQVAATLNTRTLQNPMFRYNVQGVNSNKAFMTNGALQFLRGDAASQSAVYLQITNSATNALFNKWQMLIRLTNEGAAFPGNEVTFPAILLTESFTIGVGNALHLRYYPPSVILERGIGTETLLIGDVSDVAWNGQVIPFGLTVVSNTAAVQWGPKTFFVTHSNMQSWATLPVTAFEILGSGTNTVQCAVDGWKAGYASPSEVTQMRDLSTNGVQIERVTSATLVDGNYTNSELDRIVLIPNATARTNTVYDWGALIPGQSVTIVDGGGTASGTNIWVRTRNSRKVGGSDASTTGLVLITNDYGSVRLTWTGAAYIASATSSSGGGGGVADNSITGAKIALGSDAQGDVMYYNGTDWARLAAGTSGRFLQTQGAGANPQWADAGGTAAAVGGNRAIQYSTNGASFGGTPQLTYDPTNSRVGLNISGAIPNVGIELGGTTTQAAVRMGSGTATGEVFYAGIRTISPQDLQLATQAGFTWYIDNTDGSFHTAAGSPKNVGATGARVATLYANRLNSSNGVYSSNGGLELAPTNIIGFTNVTLVLTNAPHEITVAPALTATTNTVMMTIANMPAAGSPGDTWYLTLELTNSTTGVFNFPSQIDNRGTSPFVTQGPSTNHYVLKWTSRGLYIYGIQDWVWGTGPLLSASNAPYASFGIVQSDTNLIVNGTMKVAGITTNVPVGLGGNSNLVALTTTGGGSVVASNGPVVLNARMVTPLIDGSTVSNSLSYVANELAGAGTSNTNFTLLCTGNRRIYLNGAKTNVNTVAVMGGVVGRHEPIVAVVTNRSATVCTMTLSAVSNNWINVGSLAAPFFITNGLWFSTETHGSNTYYAAKYMALPAP